MTAEGVHVEASLAPRLQAVCRALASARVPLEPIARAVEEVEARREGPTAEVVREIRLRRSDGGDPAEGSVVVALPGELDGRCNDLARHLSEVGRDDIDAALRTIEDVRQLVIRTEADVLLTAHPASCAFLDRITRVSHPDLVVRPADERPRS
jgi:hypothetical protein